MTPIPQPEPAAIKELRVRFNADAGAVRLITFLSPTCSYCRYGQGIVRASFEAFPDERLRGYVIWVPMLPTDNAEAAKAEEGLFPDERITHWYDAHKAAADAWSSFVGLTTTTWDVYALYDASATWEQGVPPPPVVWMHQLPPTPATREEDRLNPQRLASSWLRLLNRPPDTADILARRLTEAAAACANRADSAEPRFDG
jgi:hypothetical protein